MLTVEAGKYDRRITLQTSAEVSDGQGGYTTTWTDSVTVWAEVMPMAGRELFQAQQLQIQGPTRFRIRYRSGVTEKMRVSYGGKTYNVRSVTNVEEANRVLELFCEEGVGT